MTKCEFWWKVYKDKNDEVKKLKGTNRNQVELGKSKEFSKTDELIDNTDVDDAQPDLTTGVFCVILTEE